MGPGADLRRNDVDEQGRDRACGGRQRADRGPGADV